MQVILSVSITWGLCGILTSTGAFTKDDPSTSAVFVENSRFKLMLNSSWYTLPQPMRYGELIFDEDLIGSIVTGIVLMLFANITHYYVCARQAQVNVPPMHAINRGRGVLTPRLAFKNEYVSCRSDAHRRLRPRHSKSSRNWNTTSQLRRKYFAHWNFKGSYNFQNNNKYRKVY